MTPLILILALATAPVAAPPAAGRAHRSVQSEDILDFGAPKIGAPCSKIPAGSHMISGLNACDGEYRTPSGVYLTVGQTILAKEIRREAGKFPEALPFGLQSKSSPEQVVAAVQRSAGLKLDVQPGEEGVTITLGWSAHSVEKAIQFTFDEGRQLQSIKVDTSAPQIDRASALALDFGALKMGAARASLPKGSRRIECHDRGCWFLTPDGVRLWFWRNHLNSKEIWREDGRFAGPLPYGLEPNCSPEDFKAAIRRIAPLPLVEVTGVGRDDPSTVRYSWITPHGAFTTLVASFDAATKKLEHLDLSAEIGSDPSEDPS